MFWSARVQQTGTDSVWIVGHLFGCTAMFQQILQQLICVCLIMWLIKKFVKIVETTKIVDISWQVLS